MMEKHLFGLYGPNLVIMVQRQCNEFVEQKSVFTKYDVTTSLRIEVGKYVEVKHEDVKEVVEAYMSTFINYSSRHNTSKAAFEYFPCVTVALMDALTKVNDDIKKAIDQRDSLTIQRVGVGNLNKRGLCIPKPLVDKAVPNPAGEITVKFGQYDNRSYKKDRYGNIGITTGRLHGTLGSKSTFSVSVDNSGSIVVE